jgi:16S rRNA (uracil1498-N3)-methyltransferase
MQFVYHKDASASLIKIDSELHKYIFKVRRYDSNKPIYFRNLQDDNIYQYKIDSLGKKDAILSLIDQKESIIKPLKDLHIGWCIIDPKSIEKQIASLNEIGVSQITFFYCKYSQRKYKINFAKLEKLLINSSQQCGRSNIIKLNSCDNLDDFLEQNPNSYMFNFSQNHISNSKDSIKTIIVGCEGGFSNDEIDKFTKDKIVGINSNIILRSETAVSTLSSWILL